MIIVIAIARTTARARGQCLAARSWELETSNRAQTLHFMPEAWWRIYGFVLNISDLGAGFAGAEIGCVTSLLYVFQKVQPKTNY